MIYKKEIKQIWKPLKELDAEIRKAETEQNEDKSIYWVVEVGLYESMGERGLIYTSFYDEYPTEEEIKKDTIEHLKEQLKDYKEEIALTYYEEEYLKILMQTGKSKSIPRDKGRVAKLPGKRISKTGKEYTETRQNRSDEPLSDV